MSTKHSKRSAWSRSTTSKIDILAVAAFSCLLLCQCAKDSDQKEDELYIRDSERQWAESVASGDASVVERILANDFIGVDPRGQLYDKAKMISDTRDGAKFFASNHLNEVKIRFYGHTAVAQGANRGSGALASVGVSSGPIPGFAATAAGKLLPLRISPSRNQELFSRNNSKRIRLFGRAEE